MAEYTGAKFYMTTIEFTNVGRDKKTWTKTWTRSVDDEDIAREAKANGGLMSSVVDALWNEDEATGVILVGLFRPVGEFKLIKAAVATV